MNGFFRFQRGELGLKRLGGFTLIELMVTVAITGNLASVAIPRNRKSWGQHGH